MIISDAKLKKILDENNILGDLKFDDLKSEASEGGVSLVSYIVNRKIIGEKELVKLLGNFVGIPFVDLAEVQVKRDILKKLPEKFARKYNAVVFAYDENDGFSVAVVDPEDIQAIQFIKKQLEEKIKIFIATESDVKGILDQYKEEFSTEISRAIAENREVAIAEEELNEDATARHCQGNSSGSAHRQSCKYNS
jgi:hypothetical protein